MIYLLKNYTLSLNLKQNGLGLDPLFDWKTANADILKITKYTNFIGFHYRLIH